MLLLVNKSPATLEAWRHPNLGVLVGPRNCSAKHLHKWTWAADNDCFNGGLDESAFRKMLDNIDGIPGCLFVAVPDVVGDAAATLDLFDEWADQIGQPLALVGQDGMRPDYVDWSKIDALFVGGSTEWKLGMEAREMVEEAKRRGKWVHMGRVNTRRRFQYAKAIGCDSVDGTQASMFTDTHLPWMLERAAANRHGLLFGVADREDTT